VNATVDEQYLCLDGLPVRYLSAGEGPLPVLLHGTGDEPEPERMGALVLVGSDGLGRTINPTFTFVNVPGLGEAAMSLWRTPIGAYQRAPGERRCPSRIRTWVQTSRCAAKTARAHRRGSSFLPPKRRKPSA
jgi:hypothetical protein